MGHDDGAGLVLKRRTALSALGAAAAAALGSAAAGQRFGRLFGEESAAIAAAPSCVARPRQTEGPYFVDERLNRSDIRSDPADGAMKPGVLLRLAFRVTRLNAGCRPLAGAIVDVWHCDARGVYSDVQDGLFGNTKGKTFLRGFQQTNEAGEAAFTTIYPGWYPGRAVHIHFKIRSAPGSSSGHEFTSQLYFDDTLTDRVHAKPPYAGRTGRRMRNAEDGIFQGGGAQLLLQPVLQGEAYTAAFEAAWDG